MYRCTATEWLQVRTELQRVRWLDLKVRARAGHFLWLLWKAGLTRDFIVECVHARSIHITVSGIGTIKVTYDEVATERNAVLLMRKILARMNVQGLEGLDFFALLKIFARYSM